MANGIGPTYRNRPFRPQLYAPNVAAMVTVAEKLEQLWQQGRDMAEALSLTRIQALPQDYARARAIETDIQQRIDNIVQKYKGDYSQASDELRKLALKVRKDSLPGGEIAAITGNFVAYEKSKEEARKQLSDGKITPQQFLAWQNYVNRNFTGTNYDPVTSAYNTVPAVPIAPFVDIGKVVSEEIEKVPTIKKEKLVSQRRQGVDVIYQFETVEYKDPQKATEAVAARVTSSPAIMAYVDQMATFANMSHDDVMKILVGSAIEEQVKNKTGELSRTIDMIFRTDHAALEALKHRYRMQEISFKKQLDDEKSTPLSGDVNVLGVFQPQKRETFERVNLKSAPSPSLVVANPKNYPHINAALIKQIQRDHPKASPAHVWSLYNQSVNNLNYGEKVYYYAFNNDTAIEEAGKRAINRMLVGNWPIYEFDPDKNRVIPVTNASERKKILDSFLNEKNEYRARALGKTSAISGTVPYGTVIVPTTKREGSKAKAYLVAEDRSAIDAYNYGFGGPNAPSARKNLFEWVHDRDREIGDPYPITLADGKKMHIVGKRTYRKTSQGYVEEVRYYPAEILSDGRVKVKENDPLHINGEPLDPLRLEGMLLGEHGDIPLGPKNVPRQRLPLFNQ